MEFLSQLFAKQSLEELRQRIQDRDEHISNLKMGLARANAVAESLHLNVAALNKSLTTAEKALSERNVAVQIQASEIAELRTRSTNEAGLLQRQLDALKAANDQLLLETQDRSSDLTIAEQDRETLRAEVSRLTALSRDRGSEYREREATLGGKSAQLIEERRILQKEAKRLHGLEQHWIDTIEPQLRSFEEHQTLEARQGKLLALAAALDQKEAALEILRQHLDQRGCRDDELSARGDLLEQAELRLETRQIELQAALSRADDERKELTEQRARLEIWANDLAAFQQVVSQIESDRLQLSDWEKRLAARASVQEENQKIRLTDMREKRSELRKIAKELDAREVALKQRESSIKKSEKLLAALKVKNTNLLALLAACEREKDEHLRDLKHFKLKCSQSVHSQPRVASSSHPQDTPSREIKIAGYDPLRDSGDLNQLPPSLRSRSPLTAHNYHVGQAGILDYEERRELLRNLVSLPFARLQKVGPSEYMRQWGETKTAKRVRCIAYHLSWNIGFQGAKEGNELARQHWLDDLRWLTKHYRGRVPSSQWPEVPKA